ncbi:unnamed protein product [Mytilus edulis]|uniref:C-type lectin domain-containing protein n=1 Tax=Mytilus edulis TaxID=6550 RepID=A0A8S3RG72_MYTED|nr:unnamed protein product [Mytilus edulis]
MDKKSWQKKLLNPRILHENMIGQASFVAYEENTLLKVYEIVGYYNCVTTKYTNLTQLRTAKQASLTCNAINASLMTVTESSYAHLQNIIFSSGSPALDGWRFWTNNRASKQTYVEGQTYFTDFPLDEETNESSSLTYCVYGVYKHSENKIGWVPSGCRNERWNGICLQYKAAFSVTEYATMYTPKVSWQKAKSICQQEGGVLENPNIKMVDPIFKDSVIWAGISTYWTDNHSQYVGELQPRPFPNDEKQDNTHCVKATYVAEENKLKWSTESCDSKISFLCMIEGKAKLERFKNIVVMHSSGIRYKENVSNVSECNDELMRLWESGYACLGYEYNLLEEKRLFQLTKKKKTLKANKGDPKDECIEAMEDQCSIHIPDFDSKLNGTEKIEYMTNIPPISFIGIILPLTSDLNNENHFWEN